jgi:hypothetical protein
MKRSLRQFLFPLVLMVAVSPAASVTCKREVIPGAEFSVSGLPYGGEISQGGGKTVISARPPGVAFSRN